MGERERGKLAVVGAGSVGSSLAYAALIRRSARRVVLYDLDRAKVEAEGLDLAHGTQFTGSSQVEGSADIGIVSGAEVVVITAGARQKPGQTRLDLAATNVAIIRGMVPQLLEQAPDAVYVLVTNPCDLLTVAALEAAAESLPAGRVLSSGTVLDSSRLRWLLAREAGVVPGSVHAMMLGEHGDSEFPVWSAAAIGGIPLRQWRDADGATPFGEERLAEIAQEVTNAAYTVIAGKGATNYAIGLAGARIVEAILQDQHAVLPVSSVLHGYHGIDGVALSVPSIVAASGVVRPLELPFDDAELALLHRSAETLRATGVSLGLGMGGAAAATA